MRCNNIPAHYWKNKKHTESGIKWMTADSLEAAKAYETGQRLTSTSSLFAHTVIVEGGHYWGLTGEEGVPCDGLLRVDVSAEDEPDWGGTYPVVQVNVLCTRDHKVDTYSSSRVTCPYDRDSLESFVNDRLNELP